MLKKHSQFFVSLLLITDLLVIAVSWIFSYGLRFHSGLFVLDTARPSLELYVLLLVPIMLIWGLSLKAFDLYRPRRIASRLDEIVDITKACALAVLTLIAATYLLRRYEVSRLVFVIFGVTNIAALSIERSLFRAALRHLRATGYNLRYAVVVGTGDPATQFLKRIEMHPEMGLKVVGVLSSGAEPHPPQVCGVEVLGSYEIIKDVIRQKGIDHVIIALEWEEHGKLLAVTKAIDDEAVDIKFVPDLLAFVTLRGGVDEIDGLPIISLQSTPLYGWNIVIKRAFDIAMSLLAIALSAPLMLGIAVLIKLTSPGPIFYRQTRMGIGGKPFRMLKFRSMRVDADAKNGPVRTKSGDPRRTRFGVILRRMSLDELPQLFNVLSGDMSLVGPRPEVIAWIEQENLRRRIPRYMLRHKMKAGITGWAQINGWRGDTDLTKRVEYDLYYIENWSLALDIKIMWLTIWKGLVSKNAY